MPCGCQKGKKSGVLPPQNQSLTASAEPRHSGRVAVYEVVKDGQVVLATTSPSAGRAEARRLGASIRVTSRPVEIGEPVAV